MKNKKNFVLFLVLLLLYAFTPSTKAARISQEQYEAEVRAAKKSAEENEQIKAARDQEEKIKEAIKAKKVVIGMTKEQIMASLGNPRDINRTVTSSGVVHEQWCYGDIIVGNDKYIYFEDGVVTSWQD